MAFQGRNLFPGGGSALNGGNGKPAPNAEDIFEAARYLGIDPIGEPQVGVPTLADLPSFSWVGSFPFL